MSELDSSELGEEIAAALERLRRNIDDVEIPKRRQRILCLGDSYTFGPHVNNHDTFAHRIQY